jgi:hypothetical protein
MKGLASIVSVIILSAIMVMIGSLMVLSSISKGQMAITESKTKINQSILDACVEESLLQINEKNTLPSLVITTLGDCTVTMNSHVGNSWNYDIGTSDNISFLESNIVLNRGSTIAISSWIDQ